MKYLLIISLFLFSCKYFNKQAVHKTKYPQIVHNKCTNKWAILVDTSVIGNLYIGKVNSYQSAFRSIYFVDTTIISIGDTIINATLGDEIQFDDSTSAVAVWDAHVEREKVRQERRRIEDSMYKMKKRADDSLWKCQHEYEIK